MTGTEKIYCYQPQSAVVRDFFRWLGAERSVFPISDTMTLRGLSGGIFVEVAGHPNAIPIEIFEGAIAAGMFSVTLSDAWMRAKAQRLLGARR